MSRYKKASCNECELPEIGGQVPILRVTRDEKMELIEFFAKQQTKNEETSLEDLRKIQSKTLYNSLFLWEGNKRTDKKEEGCEDITEEDIDTYVVDNLFELWQETLLALDIIDRKKFEELKKKLEDKSKEQEQEVAPDPN